MENGNSISLSPQRHIVPDMQSTNNAVSKISNLKKSRVQQAKAMKNLKATGTNDIINPSASIISISKPQISMAKANVIDSSKKKTRPNNIKIEG